MRTLYSLYDKMEEELKQLCKKDPMSVEDVELVYKIIDILKDVTTIEAMKKAEMEDMSMEYSNAYRYPRSFENSMARDGSYAREGSYTRDGSYARGRDSMGRYTSRDDGNSYRGGSYEDGYSRHSKEEMINNLKTMMENARTPEERENYRATIEQMSR